MKNRQIWPDSNAKVAANYATIGSFVIGTTIAWSPGMVRFTVFACLAVATTACTKHHVVRLAPQNFGDKSLAVRTHDGRTQQVHTATRAGVLVWIGEDGEPVQLSQVQEVEKVDRGRGFVQGLGIGLLAGAGVGALMGLASGDDPECGEETYFCLRFTAADKAVLGGALIGSFGAAVGAVIGLIAGSRDVYERPNPLSTPQVSFSRVQGGGTTSLSWRF